MKDERNPVPRRALRILCAAAAVVTLCLAVGGAALSTLMWEMNFYAATPVYLEEQLDRRLLEDQARQALNVYWRGDDPAALYKNTNLLFRITDENGILLAANTDALPADAYVCRGAQLVYEDAETTAAYERDSAEPAVTAAWERQTLRYYTVTCAVDRNFPYNDRYLIGRNALRAVYAGRYVIPPAAAAAGIVFLVLLGWLLHTAGRRTAPDGTQTVTPRPLDRVPLDLAAAACLALAVLEYSVLQRMPSVLPFAALTACFVLLDAALLLWFVTTLAVRLRTHTLMRTTAVGWALGWLWRLLRAAGAAMPLIWKTALALALDLAADVLIFGLLWSREEAFVLLFLKELAAAALVCWRAAEIRRLERFARRLSEGELEEKLEARAMTGDARRFAACLNGIGDGMARAVEERTKSERMRTELITNVSHDIKTPLTSIVNYVDLMKKENVTGEPMRGYIAVLERQSARLKKLTEDLIEASKAASGVVPVQLETCDWSVLLDQALGEYDGKLRAAGLEVIRREPEGAVTVTADGRLVWRVMDNLLSNIVKYAMPGTRVYVALVPGMHEAHLTWRNVSRDPIDVPGEELTERFTRGDAARSTEGSGLGLSIARSLTELMGGTLSVFVDGDLFKATVTLPAAAPDADK